jgi:hypothetical protein
MVDLFVEAMNLSSKRKTLERPNDKLGDRRVKSPKLEYSLLVCGLVCP